MPRTLRLKLVRSDPSPGLFDSKQPHHTIRLFSFAGGGGVLQVKKLPLPIRWTYTEHVREPPSGLG